MIEIRFKNLKKSEIIREAVQSRLDGLTDKFEDLKRSRISVTIEMENSPVQAGPDLFNISFGISTGRYKGIRLKKSDANLYVALAEVIEHLLEMLNRAGDKQRVKKIKMARRLQESALKNSSPSDEENSPLPEKESA